MPSGITLRLGGAAEANRLRSLAAIFGLLGVIVGAVVNGAATALFQRRVERSDQRSAARLVRGELIRFWTLAREAAQRSPEDLPQLRDIAPILWQSYRAVLARALTEEDWVLVARLCDGTLVAGGPARRGDCSPQ
jgi:hypothetical protein